MTDDEQWMAEAVLLGDEARGTTAPNPNVGCVIVAPGGAVVGRGATAAGGRPHAEAVALAAAGAGAKGATLYTSLEPCAHDSERGPDCAGLIVAAGVARVVIALQDPDPRTAGAGIERLRAAGIAVALGTGAEPAEHSLAGYLTRLALGRPRITLKLALSIDGRIALASGASKWLTGEEARAHVHRERARCDMILVGRGTLDADEPRLDVRLPGLEDRSPRRALLSRRAPVAGWHMLGRPADVFGLGDVNDLLIEGGAGTATSFIAADLVDRLIIYRAPLLIGDGVAALGHIGVGALAEAHGRWMAQDAVMLGSDRREVYQRLRGKG